MSSLESALQIYSTRKHFLGCGVPSTAPQTGLRCRNRHMIACVDVAMRFKFSGGKKNANRLSGQAYMQDVWKAR